MRVLVLAALLALAGCATGRVYVDSGLSYSNAMIARPEVRTAPVFALDGSLIGVLTTTRPIERNESPYARIAVGYGAQLSERFSVAAEISHTSSVATGRDDGFNFVTLSVRWYPFAD